MRIRNQYNGISNQKMNVSIPKKVVSATGGVTSIRIMPNKVELEMALDIRVAIAPV